MAKETINKNKVRDIKTGKRKWKHKEANKNIKTGRQKERKKERKKGRTWWQNKWTFKTNNSPCLYVLCNTALHLLWRVTIWVVIWLHKRHGCSKFSEKLVAYILRPDISVIYIDVSNKHKHLFSSASLPSALESSAWRRDFRKSEGWLRVIRICSFVKKPNKFTYDYIRCLLTTPTCFDHLLRPS